jgi:hypothetical protein
MSTTPNRTVPYFRRFGSPFSHPPPEMSGNLGGISCIFIAAARLEFPEELLQEEKTARVPQVVVSESDFFRCSSGIEMSPTEQ